LDGAFGIATKILIVAMETAKVGKVRIFCDFRPFFCYFSATKRCRWYCDTSKSLFRQGLSIPKGNKWKQ